MSTALQRLQFIIGLTNNVSGPLHNIDNSITNTTNRMQSGFERAGLAIGAVAGLGYSLKKIIDPTREMNNALGQVRSMGVAEDVLKNLSNTALEFSMQYGESAADFVKASYDIQGAISTLSGNELSIFTKASAILAKGTKADVAEITNYVGTMYGIFQKDADRMGKANWIMQMVGQSAQAINVFKSDGHKMSEAFKGLGATATAAGIPMSEQLTVLGALQATMEGGESATKYRAFLGSVGAAQKGLNLSFVDSKGKMLSVVDILTKIHDKYGDIDTVAKSDLLKKAFGTDEAVAMVKLLSTNIGTLKTNIEDMGQIKGMEGAEKMAKAMIDPWSRVGEGITALEISLGNKLVPQLMPMVDGLNLGMATLLKWGDMFPHISHLIDEAILPVLGFTAASIAMFAVTGLGPLTNMWRLLVFTLRPLSFIFTAMRVGWVLMIAEVSAGTGFLAAANIGLAAMATQLWVNVTALWAMAGAFLANPVVWFIAALIAIAAALIYLAFNYDEVVDKTSRSMETVINSTVDGWGSVIGWTSNAMELVVNSVVSGWDSVIGWTSNAMMTVVSSVVSGWEQVKAVVVGFYDFITTFDLWGGLTSAFMVAVDFIKSKATELLNYFGSLFAGFNPFSGINISGMSVNSGMSPPTLSGQSTKGLPLPSSGNPDNSGMVSNFMRQNSSTSSRTNNVTINNNHKNKLSYSDISHALQMSGG